MIFANNYLLFIAFIFSGLNISAQSTCGTPDVLWFGTLQNGSSVSPYWVTIPGATSYNFQYRIRNISAPYSASITTVATSVTLPLSTLSPNTNYEFIVQSVCGTDTSSFSPSGWFTTPGTNSISAAGLIRGPYLTVATSNSVTIKWRTDVAGTSEVKYGTQAGNLLSVSNQPFPTTEHSITLTNLQSNTKYYYSIGVIDSALQATTDNFFYTAPPDNDPTPVRFWVTGDFGTGNSNQQDVRDAFVNYTSGQTVNGWIWLGDNAYTYGTDNEYQNNVFNVYPSQFKNIPVYPALGNHDYAQSGYQSAASLTTAFPYFDIFDLPTASGTEKYYSTNYGSLHLIALDSYGSYNDVSSSMYQWLENDLSNNTQQWTVVYFHHPPFTKGSHNSDSETELIDMRNNIIPLLEANGVDLVLSGHSHSYERSYLIKGHYGSESSFNSSYIVQPGGGPYVKQTRSSDGTIYAVCGVSGKVSSTTAGYPHDAMFYSDVAHPGSMILDVSGTALSATFLTSSGSILDNFVINKNLLTTTGVDGGDNYDKNSILSLYPNPANNEFNIKIHDSTDKNVEVKVYNMYGQLVYGKSFEISGKNDILRIKKSDMQNVNLGIYVVTCLSAGITSTKTIVIN